MTNDGAGSTWDINAPQNIDARSLGAQEIRGLRAGVGIRIDKEHLALTGTAPPDDGGQHKKGSAIPYYQTGTPANDPGGVALSSADNGRLKVDSTTKVLTVYDDPNFVVVNAGSTVTGQTDILVDMKSAGGFTNSTGSAVFVITQAARVGAFTLEIDYGSGFVTAAVSRVDFGGDHMFTSLILPDTGVLKYNIANIATNAIYQTFG